ncbi:MAG: tetratricopeptide repeat protein [Bacteroidales bacterium]|nr:tetratricopeptide repeat protein [Bacteroidales bacterium]
MKKSHFRFIFSSLLLCLITLSAYNQAVNINYKVKGKNVYSASIFFSSDEGLPGLTADEFLPYQNIFFTIKPNEGSEKEYFKENELEEYLNFIELQQLGKTIQPAASIRPVSSQDGKIAHLIMSFPKEKVLLYEPFVFISPFDTTDAILLSDEYFPDFFNYRKIYESGYSMSQDNEYVDAFNVLFPVVEASLNNPEITHYSFYNHLSEILMETVIQSHADSLVQVYNFYSDHFRSTYNYDDLIRCDSVENLIKQGSELFSPYFGLNFPKSKVFKDNYNKLLADLKALRSENLDLFKVHKMKFFEQGSYEKDYRFYFYIDLIAKMLTHIDAYRSLDGLDEIDISSIDRFPEKKADLIRTGWLDDFKIIIGLINTEIKYQHRVFNDSVMSNLYSQLEAQRQPYYEIFRAFNSMSRDHDLFYKMMETALKKCSDLELIQNIEMWIMCHNLTVGQVEAQVIEGINIGINLIRKKSWTEAGQQFDVITMQASNLALPWYYSAIVSYEKNDEFLAQNRFALALEKYPAYISPRIYVYNNLFEKADYDMLLTNINESLEVMDIWLLYFWKAKVQFAKKQYKDAILTINEKCLALNPYDFESWFLLGDTYFELKDLNKARESYQQTQRINPYDHVKYSQIMQEKFGNK